jgi:hypothetical protein
MAMRKALLGTLCALALVAASSRADAATANFQGNCSWSGSNLNCVFDALRPSGSGSSCPAGSFISNVFWDYGDGNSVFTTSTFVSHTYVPPQDAAYQVQLSIFCSDGSSASKSRWVCVSIGVPGCVQAGSGWN